MAVVDLAVEAAGSRGRGEAAARECEECVGAVRGVVVAGAVLPDAAVVVPLLAVGPQPLQPLGARLLVELAAGEGAARDRDRLELVAGPLHHGRVEAVPAHHPLGAALEPKALTVAVMRDVVLPEAGVALPRPFLQPGH